MFWARSFLNLVSYTWFWSLIQNDFKTGNIDLEGCMRLLEKMQIPFDEAHVKHIFKKTIDKRTGQMISMDDFKAIYQAIVHRPEYQDLFQAYSPDAKILPDTQLVKFLVKEQFQTEANETTAFEIISKYEPIDEVRKKKQMSFEGFVRYMNSEECSIFKSQHKTIYQDMNQPLCDYFISSSHNTYLIADQLMGPSHLWGYTSALLKGCRCLEIDCWDGHNNEPIVYHGRTLTSKIPFRSVIQVIDKYAFMSSAYPLVLSLENHCSTKQQEVMAECLKSTLGDKLLSSPLGGRSEMTRLPSPEVIYIEQEGLFEASQIVAGFSVLHAQGSHVLCSKNKISVLNLNHGVTESHIQKFPVTKLERDIDVLLNESEGATTITLQAVFNVYHTAALKFKVLVKNKKIGTIEEGMLRTDDETAAETAAETEDVSESEMMSDEDSDETIPIYQTRSPSKRRRDHKTSTPPPQKKSKVKTAKIAMALSDLVVYTKSSKFVSFQHSLEKQKCYENNSIGESKARKFLKYSAKEFISHTTRFITRIYPKGTRMTSSNYNPQDFWNVGCQMVALNFQTPGIQMELQDGKFLDNGGCGYLLKPEFLRDRNTTFTPQNVGGYSKPMSLSIRLISGHQLPPSSLTKTNKADPFVQIEIYGVPEDQAKKKSGVVKSNALNPRWNETFSFNIQVPELAMIRFCVEDEVSLVNKEFLGQYTLPVLSLNTGYRNIPLMSKEGIKVESASLFVHVWYY